MTSLALKNIATDSSYTLKSYPVISIIGKRSTGKTTMAKNLVKKFFSNTPLLVISPLDNNYYQDLTNSIINIDTFINDYENIISSKKDLTIIFDDCYYKQFSNNIINLLNTNDHLKINVILIFQSIFDISKIMKVNLDYIFMARETNFSSIRSFYSSFPVTPTFDDFQNLLSFSELKELYTFLFVDINISKYYYIKINDFENINKYELTYIYDKIINNKQELLNYIINIEHNLNMLKNLIYYQNHDN